MSIIAAGTTTTTALSSTGNTDGTLQFQVNGTTASVTLNTLGAIGVGSSPSFGSSGNVLISAGSTAAPAWGAVTVPSGATITNATLVNPALGTPASGTLSNCTVDGTDAVGFRNIPQNAQTGSYTLVLSDAGKHLYRGSGTAATWTIPANSSVAFPIGTAVTFINFSSTSVSIAITSDTMYLSSAGTTGTRTLANYGSATAVKIGTTDWVISGSGLT